MNLFLEKKSLRQISLLEPLIQNYLTYEREVNHINPIQNH
jgi:hypothetical protein